VVAEGVEESLRAAECSVLLEIPLGSLVCKVQLGIGYGRWKYPWSHLRTCGRVWIGPFLSSLSAK
jgi:hypothetical protein